MWIECTLPKNSDFVGESVVATHRVAGKFSVLLNQIWSTVTGKIGSNLLGHRRALVRGLACI